MRAGGLKTLAASYYCWPLLDTCANQIEIIRQLGALNDYSYMQFIEFPRVVLLADDQFNVDFYQSIMSRQSPTHDESWIFLISASISSRLGRTKTTKLMEMILEG